MKYSNIIFCVTIVAGMEVASVVSVTDDDEFTKQHPGQKAVHLATSTGKAGHLVDSAKTQAEHEAVQEALRRYGNWIKSILKGKKSWWKYVVRNVGLTGEIYEW